MNRVQEIGWVSHVQTSATTTGKAVATFTLCIPKAKKEYFYVDCIAYEEIATSVNRYANDKDKVFIEGRLDQYKYTKKDGTEVKKFQIIITSMEVIQKFVAPSPEVNIMTASEDLLPLDDNTGMMEDADLPF